MRRRGTRRGTGIPPEIMAADGTYDRGDGRQWAVWCEANGFSKIEFLRESMRRRGRPYQQGADQRKRGQDPSTVDAD